jgi:hypothetical protein
MAEPIEIRPEDIIRRPAAGTELAKAAEKSGGAFGDIKKYLKEAEDIVKMIKDPAISDLLQSLGISLPGGQPKKEDGPQIAIQGQGAQFQAIIQLLILKYGNISIAELVDKLKADYGNKKLSELR